VYFCPEFLNNKPIKMKKVLSIVAVAALSVAFVACGPSKEDLEKIAKQKQDSLESVEKARQDSIAAAEAEAAMAEEKAKMQAKADSARVADSLATAKGKKK
jgi:ABC-type uncharacterized transport system auxiliary subunit